MSAAIQVQPPAPFSSSTSTVALLPRVVPIA